MEPASHVSQSGRRIVLVDDYDDGRLLLGIALRQLGYEVHEAQDGQSAVQLVDEVNPHAVIADLGMPSMDGLELARVLRQRHGTALRLIALTGMAPKKHWSKSMEAGFDYYLLKPVSSEELVPYIENARHEDE